MEVNNPTTHVIGAPHSQIHCSGRPHQHYTTRQLCVWQKDKNAMDLAHPPKQKHLATGLSV